ncbi:DNA cytosine methyltransferase [Intrasporangium sp. YIM S08009]|uniref:DNA cytosine methyltransferase n=1 Tax=Intrasporangium zincisolvens TaxID=3080018 RepID=UPI002B056CA9|nr:DNA cytosine methyltransferase [Intrasporangium sp. YIM S08009]
MIPVVDLFAGPGGLNEGFSSFRTDGRQVFKTVASFEMDRVACETLTLRTAMRALAAGGDFPDVYYSFLNGRLDWRAFQANPKVSKALLDAGGEIHQLELGREVERTDAAIGAALGSDREDPWVLIGGPPCQAYSLVGRSRRRHDKKFEDDVKHFLYREYLRIIEKFRPAVFVMENVKGLLSSRHKGVGMFDRILADLQRPGYVIHSFTTTRGPGEIGPKDYVIRAEEHGVPQARHRVILLGVREDLTGVKYLPLAKGNTVSVREALEHLPRIRSQVSPLRMDSEDLWRSCRLKAMDLAESRRKRAVPATSGSDFGGAGISRTKQGELEAWLADARLESLSQHRARAHMPEDLIRYGFLAARAERGDFIKLDQLPDSLKPNHANANRPDAPFKDRFRVQRWSDPSTTVVSHIAKDGHYYIHPDPGQMRSLTVREGARLQTFPDNYYFCGNRTQQYHQVGNAVPPRLAVQLAGVVDQVLHSTGAQ